MKNKEKHKSKKGKMLNWSDEECKNKSKESDRLTKRGRCSIGRTCPWPMPNGRLVVAKDMLKLIIIPSRKD